jgi:hypothetical protein
MTASLSAPARPCGAGGGLLGEAGAEGVAQAGGQEVAIDGVEVAPGGQGLRASAAGRCPCPGHEAPIQAGEQAFHFQARRGRKLVGDGAS